MLKRVAPAIAGLVVVAALAIAVPSATGHPEECAGSAAWATTDGGYSPYLSWQGAEKSICAQHVRDEPLRRLGREAHARGPERDGRPEADRLAAEARPVRHGVRVQLRPRVRERLRVPGQLRGRHDLRRPRPVATRRSPGRSCARARRTTSRSTTGSWSRRPTRAARTTAATARATSTPTAPTTWEGLKVCDVRDPKAPAAAHQRADRLRLAHPHGAARGRPPARLRPVLRRRAAATTAAPTPARTRTTRSRSSRSRRRTRPRRRSSTSRCCSPTAATRASRAARSGRRPAATTSPSTRRSASRPAPAPARARSSTSRTRSTRRCIASVEDPNFAFWHSATISQDGKKVLFTDELGGGGQPTCNSTVGPNRGADAIYDITDPANPKFMSYFKIPREQTNQENCVAHNGNVIPVPGRDILVQSWYQGGVSVIDWTDGSKVEGARLVRPRPVDATPARARRLLVVLLLQRVHLRQRDPARLRRVQGDGQRVRGRGPLEGPHAERADAVPLR